MNRVIAAILVGVAVGIVCAIVWIIQVPDPDHSILERLAWLAGVSSAAITVPTVLLGIGQLRDIKHTLRSDSFEATAQRIARITELMLEHPSEYEELKNGPGGAAAQLLAESILDVMDTELLRRKELAGTWEASLPSLRPWFQDLFAELPGLKAVLHHRRNWYSGDLLWLAA